MYLLPFLNWGASVVLRENKLSGILYLIRHCFFSSASMNHFLVYSIGMHTVVDPSLSYIQLFVIPWTIAHQDPLSLEFSWQKYWSGLPFPSPGDLLHPGIKPRSPMLWADALPSEPPGNPTVCGGL